MGKADRTLNVQTPGAAAPTPAEPSAPQGDASEANEELVNGAADLDMPKADKPAAGELPPDMQAIVQAEVAKALAKQAAANKPAVSKAGATEVPYAEAEKQLAEMTPEQRRTARPILTDKGWLTSPEYGSNPKANLG